MAEMPMFPLGSVLFPHMPLPLRIFEDRYLKMLAAILGDEPSEFGVCLIERGSEVGGGDVRARVGTVARIVQLDASPGAVLVVAQGRRRIEVVEWLPDDPYPRAEVRELPVLDWQDGLGPAREEAEKAVRRGLALASEWGEAQWPADIAVDDDPVAGSWQLAAVAPLGPLDQQSLLASTSLGELLARLPELVAGVEETFG